MQHENMITTVTGKLVRDKWSPNHKTMSNFFFRFVVQQNQYLLGNGVRWSGVAVTVPEGTEGAVRKWVWDTKPGDKAPKGHYEWVLSVPSGVEDKLGADFDNRLNDWGENALVHKVSFAFYDKDHIEVFKLLEFVPLYDEENGALMAGVRFWQIDNGKPLRAVLYELDGFTEYIWDRRGDKYGTEK